MRPTNASSLAVSNTPVTLQKLSVDDKQELSIDPRIVGLSGDDPLAIGTIAKREAWFTKFDWAIGTQPNSLLWNAHVTPITFATTGTVPTGFLFPPLAVAACPFEYWTGTIRYRFQVVCSTFHKGRLRISYDPQPGNTIEYNTAYTRIIDITNTQDFTIDIGIGRD
jgi:hypothetical protein